MKNNATVIVSNGLWNQFRIIRFYLSQLSFGYIDILDMWACIRNASVYKPFQYRFRIFIWLQVCLIITFLVYFSTVLLIYYITRLSTFYFLYLQLKWKCSKCMFQMHITSQIYVYRYTFFRMSSFVVLFINLYTFFINNLLLTAKLFFFCHMD